jgi:hypothetical protein
MLDIPFNLNYSREYETSGYGNMTSRYSTPEGVFSGSAGRIGYTIRHKDGHRYNIDEKKFTNNKTGR